MPVAMVIDNPDGSQELYERLRTDLGVERPLGGIVHLAGPTTEGGWRIVDVWDSVDEASEFLRERFAPALRAAGVTSDPPEPEFWPIHSIMT
jgi:hypothetical protein